MEIYPRDLLESVVQASVRSGRSVVSASEQVYNHGSSDRHGPKYCQGSPYAITRTFTREAGWHQQSRFCSGLLTISVCRSVKLAMVKQPIPQMISRGHESSGVS